MILVVSIRVVFQGFILLAIELVAGADFRLAAHFLGIAAVLLNDKFFCIHHRVLLYIKIGLLFIFGISG